MASIPDALKSFAEEIRRRRVGRVAVAYGVTAWLLVEVADTVFPRLLLPDAAVTLLIIVAVAGFPVALALAWWYDLTPDPSSPTSRPKQVMAAALFGILLVAALGAATQTWNALMEREGIDSVVVLPFENLTADSAQGYLAAGVYDGLLAELSQLVGLRTVSRTSAMRYQDSGKSVPEIARELDVDAVVEGSFDRVGDEVRIRLQLVRAQPREESLWSEAYSSAVAGLPLLHGRIAQALAVRLQTPLSSAQQERLTETGPVDPETYELYLRGMYHLGRATRAEVEKGLNYLLSAVDRDPASARAYAGLAEGYARLGHGFAAPPDAWQRARTAALRAIALDPTLAAGHAALADVKLYYEWDWEGAEESFARANELNPNLPMNHYHYSWYLALFDRLDEAIAEHQRAQELDPLEPLHTSGLALLYNMDGRPGDAITEANKALEIRADDPMGLLALGDAHRLQGRMDEAIATHERLAAVAPATRWALGATYAAAGRTADARRIAADLEADGPTAIGAFGIAAIHARLGEPGMALKWVDHRPAHAWLPWARNIEWFDGLWPDPRFREFVRELRLPPPPGVAIAAGG